VIGGAAGHAFSKELIVQYLVNTAEFPRLEKPRPPILLEAPDEAAIMAKAEEIVRQVRSEGAEKVRVQVRQAVNLVLVGHAGDEA
jgi:hypothetical protein